MLSWVLHQTLFFHSQDLIYLIILHTNRQTVVNIWKSYILTAVKDMKMKVIFAVMNTLTAVQIYDFHIFITVYSPLHWFICKQHIDQIPVGLLAQLVEHCTSIAVVMSSNPVQAWIFSGLLFTTTWVVFITAKIAFIFTILCTVCHIILLMMLFWRNSC